MTYVIQEGATMAKTQQPITHVLSMHYFHEMNNDRLLSFSTQFISKCNAATISFIAGLLGLHES